MFRISSLPFAVVAAAAVGLSTQVGAQSAGTAPITLGAVLAEVEGVHPQLDAARSVARAAEARVPGARRPPDPVLQLGWMNYQLPNVRPMEPLGMTQLQAMQMLPLNGKLRLAGNVAAARADASASRVSAVSFELRARAAMTYHDLYAADGSLDVARHTRRLLEDLAAIATQMYEVGEGRQADLLRATVEIAKMDEEIVRMQAMRTAMAARLNALRLASDSAPVGEPMLPNFPTAIALDALIGAADRGRPMHRAAADEVRSAAAAEELARREIWPDLQVGLQLGRRGTEMGAETMGSLMIGAAVPLFAGSRQLRMRDEAAAMRAMAEADLAAMRADTRAAVAEAYASLVRARRLATLYRTSVLPQADATVASSLAAYRVGAVDFMTVVDAQMTLNRFRQELFTLEADEGKAWAELEMLTGQVLVDASSSQPLRRLGGSR